MRNEQIQRLKSGRGFIAALDQSGGSTPKALTLYGLDPSTYSNEDEMFNLVHEMRTRIITSPSFTARRILAVILFEKTMLRQVEGIATAEYLWKIKGIPTFLKVDNGLSEELSGVRLMKEIPELSERLDSALHHGVIGTKMRSLINFANAQGINECLDQQFELASMILQRGLIPIIEPEVDIKSTEKVGAEELLLSGLKEKLSHLSPDAKVILKLTLPSTTNLYRELLSHPNVLRIAALSGGYSRVEANEKLAQNDGLIASFSRALTEGLTAQQSTSEFDALLDRSIESIYLASHPPLEE